MSDEQRVSVKIGRTFNTGNHTSLRIDLGWEGDVRRDELNKYTQVAEFLEYRIQEVYNKIQSDKK